jgi:preprotein translocase subunit SecG
MNVLTTIVLAVQILTALGMIGLILLQHGKGADMGAAFGSGASGSLFGATGSANFLSRTTAVLAAVFFACTLLLAYFSHTTAPPDSGSVLERTVPVPAAARFRSGPPARSGRRHRRAVRQRAGRTCRRGAGCPGFGRRADSDANDRELTTAAARQGGVCVSE